MPGDELSRTLSNESNAANDALATLIPVNDIQSLQDLGFAFGDLSIILPLLVLALSSC